MMEQRFFQTIRHGGVKSRKRVCCLFSGGSTAASPRAADASPEDKERSDLSGTFSLFTPLCTGAIVFSVEKIERFFHHHDE